MLLAVTLSALGKIPFENTPRELYCRTLVSYGVLAFLASPYVPGTALVGPRPRQG